MVRTYWLDDVHWLAGADGLWRRALAGCAAMATVGARLVLAWGLPGGGSSMSI